MPVQKFRTFDEARAALWFERDDPRLLEAIAWVWALGRKFGPRPAEPGVYKFRDIQEANRSRDEWSR